MKPFLDNEHLVYAQEESARGDRSARTRRGRRNRQCPDLDELVSVLRRKLTRSWSEVAAVIDDVLAAVDEPLPLTLSLHMSALEFARDHNVGSSPTTR